MSEGSDIAVNTRAQAEEMSSQDEVDLLVGTWARGELKKWIFEADMRDICGSIRLELGMSYKELIRRVKHRLNIADPNIAIKLAYQYPEWLVIDDVDGSTPEYITDDQEVDVFIEMRRNIEEVNLFVTLTKTDNGITTGATGGSKRHTDDV